MGKSVLKAPLFADPVYDGAADPVIIWNRQEESWWIFYTNRRANQPGEGVAFVHGTDIGIISSKDGGDTWEYRGTARGLEFEPGRNTFWAPEILFADGKYHMYCSYVRGIPKDWNAGRDIVYYTSDDLMNWSCEKVIELSSDRVIDVCIYEIEKGFWKMWYKDEVHECRTYSAVSRNLKDWEVIGAEITDRPHEGPNVFSFAGWNWMITDPWCGLAVYRSENFSDWEYSSLILEKPGTRSQDSYRGGHADVLVHNGKAYIFYFVHPGLTDEICQNPDYVWEYEQKRTVLQVAELEFVDGKLICNRDKGVGAGFLRFTM
ncbi:glycoside hydrolase family protein [Anaerobium acetethylicum]|uniref:Glycosyl hydrolases family 43 n=1 Tax=Anaerobium acetethylicum TaxID=1619234 RepID=A0A1D3TVK8_9FIRM|nr:glycosyl hydrolase [Anaerobium acetethylicum]SCP98200.1 hypothetical protein SAMN05421730_101767 [Anaerobium acetethylicum]